MKWEILMKNGHRFVVEVDETKSPNVLYDDASRTCFITFGYESKYGLYDPEQITFIRPMNTEAINE